MGAIYVSKSWILVVALVRKEVPLTAEDVVGDNNARLAKQCVGCVSLRSTLTYLYYLYCRNFPSTSVLEFLQPIRQMNPSRQNR